ncbi:membrane protein [Roseivivax halodurans JCM 10272]|uniref:Membrane protein n=1 Tax=Roseivivax halodurans JCM 10272 TaxID=1449350 RepID=X7EKE5_9RHOB|nr:OpgC domain-containing protein [Roseivivax halodurans]ETX16345.1 membrane protein [Roseivivax halodurans JCM 10272]
MTTAETEIRPTPRHATSAVARAAVRDPRLDFFRGLAMFIILIAHIPGNWLTLWIPARWGFSDATEIFVFCSGMASAIAFGKVFRDQSWAMGAARTAFRCWQVYWAHIGLFFAIAVTVSALDATGAFERDYTGQLNLLPFFEETQANLIGLMTLTYVPNYFDILPMYLVILAMMPFVIALARVHLGVAAAAVVAVWLLAQSGIARLPAEPWSDREWFFNPFGWQLIFFTGFAFMSRWLPAPPKLGALLWLAIGFLVLTSPLSSPRVVDILQVIWPAAADWAMGIYPDIGLLRDKTDFGVLRYLHFLALAYVAWWAVGPAGDRLKAPAGDGALARTWSTGLAATLKVGQQSLAIFITSMYLARLLGLCLDVMGRNYVTMALVNFGGAAILVAVAYGVGWIKTHPWRQVKKGS